MPAPALSAEGVWWRYGRGPWLLRDLSAELGPGELLRVRGGNGSGKSTLLRLLDLLGPGAHPADPVVAAHRAVRADRLSEGTARRLVLEAVLALPAAVLVLDEPAAPLDTAAADRLAEALVRRQADGTAVVLAEHAALPLPGGQELDLGGAPAGEVAVVLGGTGCFRGAAARDGRLELRVPEGERDALLAEALAAGWSVLSVGAAG